MTNEHKPDAGKIADAMLRVNTLRIVIENAFIGYSGEHIDVGAADAVARAVIKHVYAVQPDERAAFEVWAREEFRDDADDPCKRGQCGYLELTVDWAWIGWQARATTQQATLQDGAAHAVGAITALKSLDDLTTRQANKGDEPVAYEFQHDETGRTTYVDSWQLENGFASNNPRWQLIGPVYRHARASTPQAVTLSDEQRDAIQNVIARNALSPRERSALSSLLAAHPTEQRRDKPIIPQPQPSRWR